MAQLILTTFGRVRLVRVEANGAHRPVIGSSKALALVVYLAFAPRRTAGREHVGELLWSDQGRDGSRHSVRQALWVIRQALGERAIVTAEDEIMLVADISSDCEAFLADLEAGDLEGAVARYDGEFLAGFAVPGGVGFEHWADAERVRLQLSFWHAGEEVVRRMLARGRTREAQILAHRLRDLEPTREVAWRLLIEALAANGDVLAAAVEADALERLLAGEDREPEPATREALRVARQLPPAAEGDAGVRYALAADLIGREREFAAIVGAWEEASRGQARHVAVTAPPGLGKTRLLRDVHNRLRARGVPVVSLRAHFGARRLAYSTAGELARRLAALPGAGGIAPDAAATLVALHPGLSSRFAVSPDPVVGEDALRRRAIAIADTVAAVAEEAPLAILIDDVHWLDAASRAVVQGLLEAMSGHRVLLVTAARPSRDAELAAEWSVRAILEPLTSVQVRELVVCLGALPDATWSGWVAVALHTATAGSPLLILETLQLALERGTLRLEPEGWRCPDPEALQSELASGGALRRRLVDLDREQHRLLLGLAVLGTPATMSEIACAAGRGEAACEVVLAQLERGGLAQSTGAVWEITHDEIAALARDTAAPEALRAANASVGEMLLDQSSRAPELVPRAAAHLADAGRNERVAAVFAPWVARARRRGEKTPVAALAAELLGEAASPERVERLVASLPIGLRLGSARRQVAAAVAVAAAVLVPLAALLGRGPDVPPDAVLLVVTAHGGGAPEVRSIGLRREPWDDRRAIDPARHGQEAALPQGLPPAESWSTSPDGTLWAFSAPAPDSGGRALFVGTSGGQPQRLTYARASETQPSWSPDGLWLVFRTTRWSAAGWADLAVVAVTGGEVRRLTRGASDAVTPVWSPHGARIAFLRTTYDQRPAQACWVTFAGDGERCFSPGGYVVQRLLGWYDGEQVLALADSTGEQALVRVHLETRRVEVVDREVLDVTASPDGRWVACLCRRGNDAVTSWLVYPVDQPGLAKRVIELAGWGQLQLAWGSARYDLPYVASVRLVVPDAGVPVETALRLRVAATDAAGDPVTPRALTWRSADTSVATVDTTGVLRPRRPGTVVVAVSAGGWREARAAITVRRYAERPLLLEDWRGNPGVRWTASPGTLVLVDSAGESPAGLRVIGAAVTADVRTADAYGAAQGLGVDVVVRGAGSVSLGSWAVGGSGAVPESDAERARAAGRGDLVLRSCGVTGRLGRERSAGYVAVWSGRASSTAPVTPGAAPGFDTLRVQIFPDGRCGIARNGRPVWLADRPVPLDQPFRVVIEAGPTGAATLVRAIELWRGVRAGVAWSALAEPAARLGVPRTR